MLPGFLCLLSIRYPFSCSFVFENGMVFAIASCFSFSAGDSFRKCVLKEPSMNPSSSMYAPAMRLKQFLAGVILLVSSNMSSLSMCITLLSFITISFSLLTILQKRIRNPGYFFYFCYSTLLSGNFLYNHKSF